MNYVSIVRHSVFCSACKRCMDGTVIIALIIDARHTCGWNGLKNIAMASWHGSIFCINVPKWGLSTDHRPVGQGLFGRGGGWWLVGGLWGVVCDVWTCFATVRQQVSFAKTDNWLTASRIYFVIFEYVAMQPLYLGHACVITCILNFMSLFQLST